MSPDNKCGTCTQCCRILAVTELQKPKNTLCQHCHVGIGCKIYDDRPASCRSFRCLWLQMQDSAPRMPLSMRPDKCKVVLHTTPDEKNIVAKVDPNYPMAWQEKEMAALLTQMSDKVFVLVDNGKRYWLVRNRDAREVRMSTADETGTEYFEGYVA
jgi:Fe-S-cluster containining protein